LLKKIHKTSIDPSKLIGKYIPNVTAKPFELTREYFEDVYRLTKSPRIGNILENWEKYESDEPGLQRPRAGSMAVHSSSSN
jgi:fatty acid synthase subunit beta